MFEKLAFQRTEEEILFCHTIDSTVDFLPLIMAVCCRHGQKSGRNLKLPDVLKSSLGHSLVEAPKNFNAARNRYAGRFIRRIRSKKIYAE